ncbi:non-reducing end alpha-L-arabinofuranosidase family hydrolase [Amycolatopsis australiensis]|uniref:non-reducing end alpha-L-arabinofuranosidase family hydrolase n=1 Tax=Amycolatopsis australiensis TaxID=546364 RepID=UPI001FE30C2E|nr:non-reducing end alpha-L-arabinofuranosidase family hydrolase [Amycolatopsis australiensis]
MDTTAWHVLLNRNSGKVVGAQGASTADGAAVVQWSDGNRGDQQRRPHAALDVPLELDRATPKSGRVSFKDFTNVVHNGKHVVYATTHDTGSSWGSMSFTPFTNWSDMVSAGQNTQRLGARVPAGPTTFSYRTSGEPIDPTAGRPRRRCSRAASRRRPSSKRSRRTWSRGTPQAATERVLTLQRQPGERAGPAWCRIRPRSFLIVPTDTAGTANRLSRTDNECLSVARFTSAAGISSIPRMFPGTGRFRHGARPAATG